MHIKMLLAAGSILGLATSAAAASNSHTLRLQGYVPVICRVELENNSASTSQATELGLMTELCNNAAGYEVWLSHAQSLHDAAVYVDGQRIALSSTGATLISRSSTAAARTHVLRLDPGADADLVGDLSLRITALRP